MPTDQARELRRDIEAIEGYELGSFAVVRRVAAIARTIALPILERDARLRNAIASILLDEFDFVVLSQRYRIADKVLAALTVTEAE